MVWAGVFEVGWFCYWLLRGLILLFLLGIYCYYEVLVVWLFRVCLVGGLCVFLCLFGCGFV